MISSWLKNVKSGELNMNYDSVINSSLATILSAESLMIGEPMEVNSKILD